MSIYDHRIVAQIYDKINTESDDIRLIRDLIGEHSWNILEPMCGTGRIISELAKDGHTVTGIENSVEMLEEARQKFVGISVGWKFENKSAIEGNWGKDYDLIILGKDAFLELPTAKEQEILISHAHASLKEDGRLFIDCSVFTDKEKIPYLRLEFEEKNDYGTQAVCKIEEHSIDKKNQLRIKQKLISRTVDGEENSAVHRSISHILSARQIGQWLINQNFQVIHQYCDYEGRPFGWEHNRVIIWAQKTKSPEGER